MHELSEKQFKSKIFDLNNNMRQIKIKLVATIGQLYDNLHLIWQKLTFRQFTEPRCYHTYEFSKSNFKSIRNKYK